MSVRRNWKTIGAVIVGLIVVVLLIIQLIPLSRDNPAIASEPAWDSAETRALAEAACFDCHSNETEWPWYAKVAPSKLLVWLDVTGGRETLNFSEWSTHGERLGKIVEVIEGGEMPPVYYTWLHSDAKLSDAEKQQLIDGLRATLSQDGTNETG